MLKEEDKVEIVNFSSGIVKYYRAGKLHREDGPAVVDPTGVFQWWVDGKLHRTDGPAIIYKDEHTIWYINGKDITPEALKWVKDRNITWPFSEETVVEFFLTFS